MLYLIKGEAIANASMQPEQMVPMLENMIVPSLKMLANMEREKKLAGGGIVGRRGLAIILDAPSNEELHKWLQALPFWGMLEWKVTPLASFQTHLDGTTTMFQRMKSMVKK